MALKNPKSPNCTPEEELKSIRCRNTMTLINLDTLFMTNPNARVINKNSLVATKMASCFADSVYSRGDRDICFVPTCECGYLHGMGSLDLICPKCHTPCSTQFVNSLDHNTWAEIPEDLPPMLHPIWYTILKKWTTVDNTGNSKDKCPHPIIDLILNPALEMPACLQAVFRPEDRGLDAFAANPDRYLDFLEFEFKPTADKAEDNNIHNMRIAYMDCLFTRHFPALHSSQHPMRNNGNSLYYADISSGEFLTAVIDLSNLVYAMRTHTATRRYKSKIFNVFTSFVKYYTTILDNSKGGKLGGKKGLFRKHNNGSRMQCSLRTVVTPHDNPMDKMDEVVLPWGIVLNVLKLAILNYLINKYHLSVERALNKFMRAINVYDPEIDKIVETILYEFPENRMPIILGRNPTLAYGSIMQLFVKRFKKDPTDQTLSIHAGIVGPANIDFDGDELYGVVIFEQELKESLETIHPSQLIFSTSDPGLSTRIGLLDQNEVCLEAYLEDDEYSDYYEEL